eukprot:COSAG06_NODE_40320_length_403_cov_0.661184_2_plen_61_part_01
MLLMPFSAPQWYHCATAIIICGPAEFCMPRRKQLFYLLCVLLQQPPTLASVHTLQIVHHG